MKKFLVVLLSVCMILTIFAGCVSKTGTEPVDTENSTDNDEKDSLSGEIEILWQIDGAENIWDYTLDYFTKNYPDVEITFNKDPNAFESIGNRLRSGTPPDVFYTWHTAFDFASAYKDGLLTPVDDIMEAPTMDGSSTLKEFLNDKIYESGLYENKHYFIPFQQLMYMSFYSGKLFEEKGWKEPHTWDEFIELCEQIKNDGSISPIIYAGAYPEMFGNTFVLNEIYNNDPITLEKIYNAEPAWNEPAALKAVQRLEMLIKNGYVYTDSIALDHIQSQMDFVGYKAAFIPAGSWMENEMSENWPDDFDLTPFILPSESGKWTVMLQQGEIVIPKQPDGEKTKILKELFRVFFSSESTKNATEKTGLITAYQEIPDEIFAMLSPAIQEMYTKIEEKQATILTPNIEIKYGALMPEYYNNMNGLVNGEVSAEQFCENMNKAVQNLK